MLTDGARAVVVEAGDGRHGLDRLTELMPVVAEPVIPDFGEASDCVAENRLSARTGCARTGIQCSSRRSSSTSS